MKKPLLWSAFGVALLAFAALQFAPPPPLLVPAELPPPERAAQRLLNFEGIESGAFNGFGPHATMHEALDAQWGGFDSYVRDGLGLSAADVNRLRDRLLAAP